MAIFLLANGMAADADAEAGAEAEADADAEAEADADADSGVGAEVVVVGVVVVVGGGTVGWDDARRRSQCLSIDIPNATGKAALCRREKGLYTMTDDRDHNHDDGEMDARKAARREKDFTTTTTNHRR